MKYYHPLQQLTPQALRILLQWSRALFWVVLLLYAIIARYSMPPDISAQSILDTPLPELGALGFWAGYDFLFMLVYTLFFKTCCIWVATSQPISRFWKNTGILLAWAMVLQLLVDMAENYCIWQIALGQKETPIPTAFFFLEKAKVPIFAAAAAYALFFSIKAWWHRFSTRTKKNETDV